MTDFEVGVRLRADGKGFQGEIRLSRETLDRLTGAVRKGEAEGRRYAEATRGVERATRRAGRSFLEAHGQMTRYISGAVGVHQITRAFRSAVQATIRQEAALRQVEARIRATGGAAGVATQEMAGLAASLQRVTTYGDEQSLEALGRLLSFRAIAGPALQAALPLVQDLATALGQDLNSAAIQVGKALEDPARGLTYLARSGTTFTKAQTDLIRTLHEAGRTAEAQTLVLDELRSQYGGAARAARETLGGALAALKNAIGDLTEAQSESTESLRGWIEAWTRAVERVDVARLHASLASLAAPAAVLASVLGVRLVASLGAAAAASLGAAAAAARGAGSLRALGLAGRVGFPRTRGDRPGFSLSWRGPVEVPPHPRG